jgi:phosphatidylserine/phosphatidylglycerophosphate/cardiolipin synthase-like enzyme
MTPRRLFVSTSLVALAAALALAAGPPSRPPVELVESVPVESGLGNPELRQAKDVWLEMIRGAKRSLDCEEFYLSTWPNEPMDPVVQAIGDAAKRGVKVRILLDNGMYRTYPKPADSLGKLRNIQVKRFAIAKITGSGIQHSKFFLVDGRETFLGSQNFDWRALSHIHEMGVRIADPLVTAQYSRVFEMDWSAAGAESLAHAPVASSTPALPFRLVQAPGDTVELWPGWTPKSFAPDTSLWDLNAIVRLLDSAKSDAVAQVLTYSTKERGQSDDTLDRALRRAAARGVRVRLIVSDWQKGRESMAVLESLSTVPNIEVRLSTVPEWSGGYIPFARVEHCKFAVADSAMLWVGTSNWEPGYFLGTRNVGVTMRNQRLALQACRSFETSWAAASATPVKAGVHFEAKTRGETPPPGVKKYGG